MDHKHYIKKAVCLLLMLVLLAGGLSAAAPVRAADANETRIFNYLKDKMGLNTAAACGVVANIYYESLFDPHCSGDGGTSYGICQWHASRYTNLKNFCYKNGYDYTTLDGQLAFLNYELRYDYTYIYEHLLGVENTADGAYDAGYYWCYYFERPAGYNRGVSDKRGAVAMNDYWPVYAPLAPATQPTEPVDPVTPAIGSAETSKGNAVSQIFARLLLLIKLIVAVFAGAR